MSLMAEWSPFTKSHKTCRPSLSIPLHRSGVPRYVSAASRRTVSKYSLTHPRRDSSFKYVRTSVTNTFFSALTALFSLSSAVTVICSLSVDGFVSVSSPEGVIEKSLHSSFSPNTAPLVCAAFPKLSYPVTVMFIFSFIPGTSAPSAPISIRSVTPLCGVTVFSHLICGLSADAHISLNAAPLTASGVTVIFAEAPSASSFIPCISLGSMFHEKEADVIALFLLSTARALYEYAALPFFGTAGDSAPVISIAFSPITCPNEISSITNPGESLVKLFKVSALDDFPSSSVSADIPPAVISAVPDESSKVAEIS